MPRDYHQIAEAGEARDDVLRNPFAEVIVARIAREIGEREHGDAGMANRLALRSFEGADADGRLAAHLVDAENLNRFGDVLQIRATNRSKRQPCGLVCRGAKSVGDQDAARIGERLQARRHIDAVSVSDRIMKDHVANVEPDPELDRLSVAPHRLLAEFRLDLNGETKRPLGTIEQRNDPVPGDVGDLAAVIADQRSEELQRSRHLAGAARLVEFHSATELDHVRKQHGRAPRGRLGPAGSSRWFRSCHPPRRSLTVRDKTLPEKKPQVATPLVAIRRYRNAILRYATLRLNNGRSRSGEAAAHGDIHAQGAATGGFLAATGQAP